MALVTHQMQGSYVTLPSRNLPLIKGIKLKKCITTCQVPGRNDMSYLLKRNVSLSVGTSCIRRPKPRALRISAFKGNVQNDEPGGRASGPKTAKNSVRLKETEGPMKESPSASEISVAYTSEENEHVTSSPVHRLFKKWLMNLRTQSSGEVVNGILEGEGSPDKIPETEVGIEKKESKMVLKSLWSHFLALDATIKIPLLIVIPMYLAVNVVYGAEVSKELTPLWVVGPVIVALYVKMFKWLLSLYAFTFQMTVQVIKSIPSVAYTYIVQGKLKEALHTYLIQPLLSILNFKEFTKTKKKEFQVWASEKYLDFVESIWPIYCRTIRFLKRASFI